MKSFRFVVIGGLAIVDSIKIFFTPIECERCKILETSLEYERSQKEYFSRLLLLKAGVLRDDSEVELDLASYPSIRHTTTLSTMRKMARDISKKNSEESKEAKNRFEEELGKSKNS